MHRGRPAVTVVVVGWLFPDFSRRRRMALPGKRSTTTLSKTFEGLVSDVVRAPSESGCATKGQYGTKTIVGHIRYLQCISGTGVNFHLS